MTQITKQDLNELPIGKKVEVLSLINEIREFYKYCNSFYNEKDGVYPIASKKVINMAVDKYIKQSRRPWPLEFDSMDREQVRIIIGK